MVYVWKNQHLHFIFARLWSCADSTWLFNIARFCRRGFVLRAFVTARFCLRAFVCAVLSCALFVTAPSNSVIDKNGQCDRCKLTEVRSVRFSKVSSGKDRSFQEIPHISFKTISSKFGIPLSMMFRITAIPVLSDKSNFLTFVQFSKLSLKSTRMSLFFKSITTTSSGMSGTRWSLE